MKDTCLSLILSNGRERDGVLVHSILSSVTIATDIRVDSMIARVGVRSFEVEDRFTRRSAFPKIISSMDQRNDDLLTLVFENNPIDQHANADLSLSMQPLHIVINRYCLERIGQFFTPPKEVSKVANQIKQRASKGANVISTLTRAQLEDAVKSHKTIALDIRIKVCSLLLVFFFSSKYQPLS